MVKDHSDSEREKTRCCHMGYSFRLAARVLLYASCHRQDNTYHSLCYTSRGALAGTRNSSMGHADRVWDKITCKNIHKSCCATFVCHAFCVLKPLPRTPLLCTPYPVPTPLWPSFTGLPYRTNCTTSEKKQCY